MRGTVAAFLTVQTDTAMGAVKALALMGLLFALPITLITLVLSPEDGFGMAASASLFVGVACLGLALVLRLRSR